MKDKQGLSEGFINLAEYCEKPADEMYKDLQKLLRTIPTDEELEMKAETAKAVSDPTRLKILYLLREKPMCVCEIMMVFETAQPTISHHLKILKAARLVTTIKEGKWTFYSLRAAKAAKIVDKL